MTSYLLTIVVLVAIAATVGLALNFQWGLGGMVNFGLGGFYMLGAYVCALLATAGIHPILAMMWAMVTCASACMLVSLISLRLSEDYLAIVTLGFAECVHLIVLNEAWLTNGALGVSGIPQPFSDLIGSAAYPGFFAIGSLVVLALIYLLFERITRSPFGRALRAVREDPIVASTLGKRVWWLRMRAFGLGGVAIGAAGALHSFYYTYIDPAQFGPIITAYAFMAVIAGGRGSHRGLLLGAGSVMVLLEGTRFLKDWIPFLDAGQLAAMRLVLIGVGLVLLLIYRPQGLRPEYRLSTRGRADSSIS
jgi:branched-chain amino acid transport system permease protein